MVDAPRTVLCRQDGDEVTVFEQTFGKYRDQYLWNQAWCFEFYDTKPPRVPKHTRTWYGTVTPEGIKCLRRLGWSIRQAHAVAIDPHNQRAVENQRPV